MSSNAAQFIMVFVIYLYGLGGAAMLFGASGQQLSDGQLLVLPAVCGIGVLTYLMLGAFMPAAENKLQPETLAALPITAKQLLRAHVAILLLQSRGILVVLLSLAALIFAGVVGKWSVALVVMMIVQTVTTLLFGEVVASSMSRKTDRKVEERKRTLASMFGFVIIIGYNLFINVGPSSGVSLTGIGRVLAWSPFAAATGVVASMDSGQWGSAAAQAIIAVGTIAGLFWLWSRSLAQRLTAPLSSKVVSDRPRQQGSLLLPWAPKNRYGMIYSRAARYLRRDSRLGVQLVMIPIMAAFFAYQGLKNGQWYPGAFVIGLLAGVVASNDFGYDGPANWVHMVSAVPSKLVILGRHVAMLIPVWLTALAYCLLMIVMSEHRVMAICVAIAGMSFAATSSAIGMIFSVRNPYPVAEPGTNPWQDKSGYSAAAFLTAFGALLTGWIPLVPGLVVFIYGTVTGNMSITAIGAVLCALLAGLSYWLVYRHAARYVDRHYPEIFSKVRAWSS